jgi:hypothetical protein
MKGNAVAVVVVVVVSVSSARALCEPAPRAVALVDSGSAHDGLAATPDRGSATVNRPPPLPGHHQLRLDLGAGAPGGLMAVRYSRVLSHGTRIEPAAGLGLTGVVGSLLVTQPLADKVGHTRGGTPFVTTFEIYGGYGASHLRDGLHHPWAGREMFIPNGTYHWIDLGISTQTRFRSFLLTSGVGMTKLLAGPEGIGGDDIDEETFWWLFPEGWLGKHAMGPALWSSVGYEF